MWHETIAKRGSSKVASCLRHSTQTYQTGTKSGVFFVSWYNELHKEGVFDILSHKLPTRGHTFLRNDSDFAQFEKIKSSAIVLRL